MKEKKRRGDEVKDKEWELGRGEEGKEEQERGRRKGERGEGERGRGLKGHKRLRQVLAPYRICRTWAALQALSCACLLFLIYTMVEAVTKVIHINCQGKTLADRVQKLQL